MMQIRLGYELIYDCPQPTPMLLMLNVHYTRISDIVVPDHLVTSPSIPIRAYRDGFGNWCNRIVAPAGRTRLSANGIVKDTGEPDVVAGEAQQHAVEDLPDEALVFLLGSRYCETDRLSEIAWSLFGKTSAGWARVQAICDYVHQHMAFGYEHARATRTAWEAYCDRTGVCRDFAHLAVAFCRCMNIPARYCTGYLGDIGVPIGDPVTTEDVKYSFERYQGTAAQTLKDHVSEIEIVDPRVVRFHLKASWPDFMTFYGTTATAAGIVVPRKYLTEVGEDGFKKHPIGAGPYKFVSSKPGIEVVLEANPGYWRRVPSVKTLVMRSIPDATTRALTLKTGEADIAYVLDGTAAESIKDDPGIRIVASKHAGATWIEFPEQCRRLIGAR